MPRNGKSIKICLVVLLLIFLGAIGFIIFRIHTKASTSSTAKTTGCVSLTLSEGSSGDCVSDVKAMVNYIETSGLNECPFTNDKTLSASNTYDVATALQVKTIQTWTNCYNKQEGSNDRLQVSGKVDAATWGTLCSYGYKFAKQSQSSTSQYHSAAITAGKAAGCE